MYGFGTEELDFVDELRMRRWARENYVPEGKRDAGWHPVILEEMHRNWAHLDVLHLAADGPAGRIRAFVNYWIVGDEVHVLNVATHPAWRRRGIAQQLLAHVDDVARAEACRYLTLEVRRGNHGAVRLYRRHGYRPVGLRPRYYEDGEDAILMIRDL